MRTFEEIKKSIDQAIEDQDADALEKLAEEIASIDTPEAIAERNRAFRMAYAISGDPSAALEHHRRALERCIATDDRQGQARALMAIGRVHRKDGDHNEAIAHLERALALYETLDLPADVSTTCVSLGLSHYALGDYARAQELFVRAQTIDEERGDLSALANSLTNLGNIQFVTARYPEAMTYYRRALDILDSTGDTSATDIAHENIGMVYSATGDADRALDHFNRALDLAKAMGDLRAIAHVHSNIGSVHSTRGDYTAALEHFNESRTLRERASDKEGVAHSIGRIVATLIDLDRDDEAQALLAHQSTLPMIGPGVRANHFGNLATLAERRGDLDAARDHLSEALSISEQAGRRSAEAAYHKRLRDLAQKSNDFASYIAHNTTYTQITEEIHGREATQRLAMLEADRKAEAERQERERERALLYGALPKSVAERMLRGEKISGDHFDAAAVLFADVVDFTQSTSDIHPTQVVAFLDELFATFDAICERHSVIKVKTIGDSYMCFKGDGSPSENATAVAAVAFDILAHVAHVSYPTNSNDAPLRMRLGLHIGPATAGVLGTQRLQYDVWGDTVNVASRMESTGEAGRIHVSSSFALAIKGEMAKGGNGERAKGRNGEIVVTPRGEVHIKGKGPMTTFWLERA